MLRRTLAAVFAAAALVCPAGAQDAYLIGVTGAMTGPAAGTNGPPIEGLRLYVDRLNAAGGINGKKIQLTVLDDQVEPSKAAANAKRLLTQDNVSSWSSPVCRQHLRQSSVRPSAPMWLSCSWERFVPKKSIRPPICCNSAPPLTRAATTAARRSLSSRRRQRSRYASALPPWQSRSRAAKSTMPRSRRRPWA